MINVSIMKFHNGYHYELIKYPPKNVTYCLEKKNLKIYMDALLDNPDGCERYLFFSGFYKSINKGIPYFSDPADLIHCNTFPVVNKVPHVIDMESFYFPYLIDSYEFRLIHELKKTFVSVKELTPKPKARLEKTKTFLRSKFCKKILPWSKWCRNYILDFIDEPEIVKKIEVLYPAVHNAIHKRRPAKNIRLLFICGYGASFERKGGDDVMRLFDILRHYYNNIELTFIGNMPENVSNKYRKYKNIKIYPFLGKKELFEVYKKSDIFILPTKHDSFGFSLLEAMNFNLPIVTTKGRLVPATQEIVNDGISGFLIERKDMGVANDIAGSIDFKEFIGKIRVLIENKKIREEMGKAGKEEIASGKFSLKKRNKRLREIYEEAL